MEKKDRFCLGFVNLTHNYFSYIDPNACLNSNESFSLLEAWRLKFMKRYIIKI